MTAQVEEREIVDFHGFQMMSGHLGEFSRISLFFREISLVSADIDVITPQQGASSIEFAVLIMFQGIKVAVFFTFEKLSSRKFPCDWVKNREATGNFRELQAVFAKISRNGVKFANLILFALFFVSQKYG